MMNLVRSKDVNLKEPDQLLLLDYIRKDSKIISRGHKYAVSFVNFLRKLIKNHDLKVFSPLYSLIISLGFLELFVLDFRTNMEALQVFKSNSFYVDLFDHITTAKILQYNYFQHRENAKIPLPDLSTPEKCTEVLGYRKSGFRVGDEHLDFINSDAFRIAMRLYEFSFIYGFDDTVKIIRLILKLRGRECLDDLLGLILTKVLKDPRPFKFEISHPDLTEFDFDVAASTNQDDLNDLMNDIKNYTDTSVYLPEKEDENYGHIMIEGPKEVHEDLPSKKRPTNAVSSMRKSYDTANKLIKKADKGYNQYRTIKKKVGKLPIRGMSSFLVWAILTSPVRFGKLNAVSPLKDLVLASVAGAIRFGLEVLMLRSNKGMTKNILEETTQIFGAAFLYRTVIRVMKFFFE